jgi:hypothetical protein
MLAAFTRLIDSNSLQFVIELCTLYGLPLYLLPVLKKSQKQSICWRRRFSFCQWNTPLMWCCLFQKLLSYCAVCTFHVHSNWSYIVSSAMLVTCSVVVIFCVQQFVFRVTDSYETFLGWQWICHTVRRAAPQFQSVNVWFVRGDIEADGGVSLVCKLRLVWRNWNTRIKHRGNSD